MTGDAVYLGMPAFQRISGQLRVVECVDFERRGEVTGATGTFGRSETKLPGVCVAMAARAVARRPAVGRPASTLPILLRGTVAAIASGFGVRSGERPGAVVDPWRVPASFAVAVGAAAGSHLVSKLHAVWILVTVRAGLGLQVQGVPRTLPFVAAPAGHGLMLGYEWELGAAVLFDGEAGGPEPVLVVAGSAVGRPESPAMYVAMTVPALFEL